MADDQFSDLQIFWNLANSSISIVIYLIPTHREMSENVSGQVATALGS